MPDSGNHEHEVTPVPPPEGESAAPESAESAESPTPPSTPSALAPGASLQWFIIHTYSGFERKVAESLRSRVQAFGMEGKFARIEIPTEPVAERRAGKTIETQWLFYTG